MNCLTADIFRCERRSQRKRQKNVQSNIFVPFVLFVVANSPAPRRGAEVCPFRVHGAPAPASARACASGVTPLPDYFSFDLRARRKPTWSSRYDGVLLSRRAERQSNAKLSQEPPRMTRTSPDAGPSGLVTGPVG